MLHLQLTFSDHFNSYFSGNNFFQWNIFDKIPACVVYGAAITNEMRQLNSDSPYIIIGLSRCVTTGVAWMDGRSRVAGARQAQAASGELRAVIDGSDGGGGVDYEARGYKRGWADERAGRRASRRPKSSQNRA